MKLLSFFVLQLHIHLTYVFKDLNEIFNVKLGEMPTDGCCDSLFHSPIEMAFTNPSISYRTDLEIMMFTSPVIGATFASSFGLGVSLFGTVSFCGTLFLTDSAKGKEVTFSPRASASFRPLIVVLAIDPLAKAQCLFTSVVQSSPSTVAKDLNKEAPSHS